MVLGGGQGALEMCVCTSGGAGAAERLPSRLYALSSAHPPCAATEKEQDAALGAILDRVVGLGWERGWTPKLSAR